MLREQSVDLLIHWRMFFWNHGSCGNQSVNDLQESFGFRMTFARFKRMPQYRASATGFDFKRRVVTQQ